MKNYDMTLIDKIFEKQIIAIEKQGKNKLKL